jgi:HAE1 family hydrophobic/amphiphilic exporter-1
MRTQDRQFFFRVLLSAALFCLLAFVTSPTFVTSAAAQEPAVPQATPTSVPATTTDALPSLLPPVPQATPIIEPPASPTNVPPASPTNVPQVTPTNSPQATPTATPSTTPDELPSLPAVAPNYEAPERPLPDLGRVGVDMTEQRPLSLREALEMALVNNKDIEVARSNVKIAEFDLRGARGIYDPRVSSLAYYERIVTPVANFLAGGGANATVTQSDFTGTFRFEGLAPNFGGSYRADFSTVRLVTDNQLAVLNPQYPSALTFSYTQPLLRGLSFDGNRRQIEVAKKNLSLTDAQFRQRTIETIASVQRAYWDLVYALRNLQIQRDAVRDARTQLEHNKRMVEQGMLAPIDVVAAEAQVTTFEQSVYSALEEISRAENGLKNMIAENRNASIWKDSIVPTDAVDLTPPVIALEEAMQAALENRPELKQSDAAREINQIDQRYFREQTKPQLDLVGSYGAVGLAGSLSPSAGASTLFGSTELTRQKINEIVAALPNSGIQPIPPPNAASLPPELLGGTGSSLANLAANRYNNFRVGVQVNLPLRNRTAEAQLGRSLVEGQRIGTQREQLEQLIQVDVRNALQLVRTAEARLRAAAATRNSSEQQYQSEQRRFDVGQSTLFLVLERQTTLTTARGNELRAQTDLNKAIADLQRATGNSLQANNVVVSVR